MRLLIFSILLILGVGCTKSSPPPPILVPVEKALCDGETAMVGGYAGWVVDKCGGSAANVPACSTYVQGKMGALNICNVPLQPQLRMALSAATWQKFGDVKKGDIDQAKIAMAARAMGLLGPVGAIVCPLGDGLLVGLISGAVMSSDMSAACGCTHQIDDPNIDATVVAVCEAALGSI